MRHDNRSEDELRPISVQRNFTGTAAGSVLIKAGRTTLLCTASLEEAVPPWKQPKQGEAATGWVTAEYNMLPGSTAPRKRRGNDGRGTEIQRLIGRSLRAVVDFAALGERTVVVDCDVLEADGGTRTLAITGGFIALVDALATLELSNCPLLDSVAAVSVGLINGRPLLDLDYSEDSSAEVDLNVVMTGSNRFIEVQGTAERQPFQRERLDQQLDLAQLGIQKLTVLQKESLGTTWPQFS